MEIRKGMDWIYSRSCSSCAYGNYGLFKPGRQNNCSAACIFSFFNAVELNGRRLVYNHLKLENGRYNFDFENLKSQIDSSVKMLILSNPHNPGGSVWTKEELTELASICIENNILIVSDEIHGDLVFKEYKFTHLASISEEISNICISLIAPSKTFNLAGLASSVTIISNERLRLRFNEVLEQWHVGMGNLFGIVALESAFNSGDQWLDELLEYVNDNINYFSDYIRNHIPEITFIKPEGTYLIWIDFSKLGMNDKDLNEFIIKEAKLGLNKGTMFGPGGEGYMRMNLACPKETLNKALEQLNTAIEKRFR